MLIILWWQKVTVTPEAKRTTVFKRGSWKGFNALIPTGGHVHPNSGVGERLLWKKAQKNETKNITSEIINKIIPIRNPVVTALVWNPKTVPSRTTSRHHWNETKSKAIKAKKNKVKDLKWKKNTKPKVKQSPPNPLIKGQGLNSTKWKGWRNIFSN